MSRNGPQIGARVRFAPNPRWPRKTVEAEVIGRRKSPNANTFIKTSGWLDTRDDAGFERSVRPSRCEIIERAK